MRRIAGAFALFGLAGCGGAGAMVLKPTSPPPAKIATVAAPGVTRLKPAPVAVFDHGPRTRRWVALTFDADMTRAMLARLRSGRQRTWYDAAVVHELESTHTPATVFLTGLWTLAYPNVVRRLARDKLFELENHSVDHAGWLSCWGLPIVHGELSKLAEVVDASADIRRVAGVTPRYFRFPGGCHSASDLRLLASTGERAVGWDVVSGDPFQPNPAPIITQVLTDVRPGSIVIMHIVGPPNAPATDRALPAIISDLRARGYRFVTVQQLIDER